MQVPIDHSVNRVAQVPSLSQARTAPQREMGREHTSGRLGPQRIVVDDHNRLTTRQRRQTTLSHPHPRPTRIRVRMQHHLVSQHVPSRDSTLIGLLGGQPRRVERVVIQQKSRHHMTHTPPRTPPDRKRILRRHDTNLPTAPDQLLILGLPPQTAPIPRKSPQLMVAGHPHHPREPGRQRLQHRDDLVNTLTNIPRHHEPVLRMLRHQ